MAKNTTPYLKSSSADLWMLPIRLHVLYDAAPLRPRPVHGPPCLEKRKGECLGCALSDLRRDYVKRPLVIAHNF